MWDECWEKISLFGNIRSFIIDVMLLAKLLKLYEKSYNLFVYEKSYNLFDRFVKK